MNLCKEFSKKIILTNYLFLFNLFFYCQVYFVLKIPFKYHRGWIFARQKKKSRIVCKDDENIGYCKNIIQVPYIYFGDIFERKILAVRNATYCSTLKICEKIKIQTIYYTNRINNVLIKSTWSNVNSIPVRLMNSPLPIPLLYKFRTKNVFLKYIRQECKKRSMIYSIENPLDSLPYFWQISFAYSKYIVKVCDYIDSEFKVKCLSKWMIVPLNEFSTIDLHCEKNDTANISNFSSEFLLKDNMLIFFFVF